ncbi:MAG: alpha/beta hydrolase [Alphaproteobacteria bacterium]|nr:alpha/beta hydrolase [Alphaproteobacteria bacterium]
MSQDIYCHHIKKQDAPAERLLFWGHGWGQSHRSLLPLAESLSQTGDHILVDFQGFGQSPAPEEAWDSGDYAEAMAKFIRAQTDKPIFWVGHSFGCRVGLELAARHPDLIAGLCLIAAAGLKRKRSPFKKAYFKARIMTYKALKKLIPFGLPEEWLMKKFASADYKNAGNMRQILVKVVNEDLSDVAQKVQCPTLLIFGENDDETPPEFGERYKSLIKDAELIVMDGFDHYTILSDARHQVAHKIKGFVEQKVQTA